MSEASLLDKIRDSYAIVFGGNNLQCVLYSAIGLYGEHLQELVRKGSMADNWAAGHLSDISAGAVPTLVVFMIAGKNKAVQLVTPFVTTTVLSLDEYLHFLPTSNQVTDFQDVLCYAGGTLLAYIGNKIITSERASNAIRNIL